MNKSLIIAAGLVVVLILSNCQQQPFIQGQRIYEVNCENCHMADGRGLGVMYPDITKSSYLTTRSSELPCLIINGKEGQIMDNVDMPPNNTLTPVGMNNLINYLNHTWGDKTISNLNEIRELIDGCQ